MESSKQVFIDSGYTDSDQLNLKAVARVAKMLDVEPLSSVVIQELKDRCPDSAMLDYIVGTMCKLDSRRGTTTHREVVATILEEIGGLGVFRIEESTSKNYLYPDRANGGFINPQDDEMETTHLRSIDATGKMPDGRDLYVCIKDIRGYGGGQSNQLREVKAFLKWGNRRLATGHDDMVVVLFPTKQEGVSIPELELIPDFDNVKVMLVDTFIDYCKGVEPKKANTIYDFFNWKG